MNNTKLNITLSLDKDLNWLNKLVISLIKSLSVLALLVLISNQNKAYSNTDSLFYFFQTDTIMSVNEKIYLADSLTEVYAKSDLKKSIECESAIYHYAKSNNDKIRMVRSLENISTKQNRACDYVGADTCLRMLLFLYEESAEKTKIGDVVYNLASNYYDWSNYAKANEYFIKAQEYFVQNGDKQGIAKSMKGEAVVVSTWGDYEKAIGLMQNARDIYGEIQDELGLAGIYLSLGVVMQEWNKLDRALEYYNQAIQYYHSNGLKVNEVNLLLHIGDIYLLKEEYYRAISTYRMAQRLELEVNHKKLRSIVLSNIGEAYYHLNQLDSALFYQTKALVLKNEVGDNKRIAISYFVIGNIYLKLKQNDSSLFYLNKSLLLARDIGFRDTEIDALESLSELYKSMNNLYLAYEFLKKHQKLKELTFTEHTNHILEELAVKYEAKKKQTENELLKQRNNFQQLQLQQEQNTKFFTIIFASFIIFIAFIIVFFINHRVRESKKNFTILSNKNKEITKQKEEVSVLNQDLEESRERFRGIVNNATIGIYQTNPQGDILYANKYLINTLEFDNFESLKQINLNSKYHPTRGDFLNQITEDDVITGREDVWKKADGSNMYVMESAWVVKNTDGSIKYIEGLVEDITKRKEVELALKDSQKDLKETNKTLVKKNKQVEKSRVKAEKAHKTKSAFLANISHEIRTPMNSIIGFTELLLGIEKESKKKSYLNAIDSSSKNLLSLINDILDLSKIQAGKLKLNYEPISLLTIFNEIEQIFSLLVKSKGIQFIINIDNKLPEYLNIDGVRIRQILLNIIGNAIKFTNKGYVKVDVNIKPSNKNTNKINLEIVISDSGPGISKKDQSLIFSAFSQSENLLDKDYGGTGLGLSITKQLVELMDGNLKLDSKLGEGSIFTISIPGVAAIRVKKIMEEGKKQQTIFLEEKKDFILPPYYQQFDLSDVNNQIELELNEQLGSLFSEISSNRIISDILRFAEKIEKFASSSNIEGLHLLSLKLKQACERFEIEEIESILIILKPIFNGK